MGPKGILDANGGELRCSPQRGVDTSPSYYSSGFPGKMRAEYVRQWEAEHAIMPGREPMMEDVVYRATIGMMFVRTFGTFSRLSRAAGR